MNGKKVLKMCLDRVLSLRNRYLALLDAGALAAIPLAALFLRLGWPIRWPNLGWALGLYVAASLLVRLPVFYALGLYRRCWRYASVGDMTQVLIAVGVSTAVLALLFGGVQIGLAS